VKLTMLVSPGTWDLIERLGPHLDVAIELFDTSLAALLPERSDPVGRRLRALAQAATREPGHPDDVTVRDRLMAAIRTGSHQVFASGGLRLGVFPLRHERTIVGLLVAAAALDQVERTEAGADAVQETAGAERPAAPEPERAGQFEEGPARTREEGGPAGTLGGAAPRAMDDPVARRIERIGWSLRAAIEADIDTRGQLGSEQERSRWLATALRFLEHLYECPTEDDLAETLVQAAAIWGDVDARLYRRDLEGRFVLHTVLPAAARDASPAELPPSVAQAPQGAVRLSSLAELEALGWRGPGEVLLMAVPGSVEPQWMLAVAGSVDARFERVLAVACRTLGSCLERIEAERARALSERLVRRFGERGGRLPVQVAAVLGEVAQAAGASWARVLAVESDGGPARVLATVGGAPLASLALPMAVEDAFLSAERMLFPLRVGLSRPALLELGVTGGARFGPQAARLVESAAALLAVWLAGAFQGLAIGGLGLDVKDTGAFEARIQDEIERARRFNLQAGLLVIDTVETSRDRHALALQPMIEALRSQLRASDLIGRLKDGNLAALLVQTDSRGVAVVAGRVEARLAQMAAEERLPETVLGRAAYPTAGETAAALVAAAREDLSRRAAPLLHRSSPRSSAPNLRAVR
jgi:GGDEF domain-containing protein